MTLAQIPNALTMLRLVLAVAFFVLLSLPGTASCTCDLSIATGLFVVAALTDALDGFLARRWQVVSRFGRIMDPFCDKVLVLGAFVLLAGPQLSGLSHVQPWMVVVMLSRELLVTAIRSDMEAGGSAFGAVLWGKLKMILQSVAVPAILLAIAWLPADAMLRDWPMRGLVWLTVAATVMSGLPYLVAAFSAAGKTDPKDPGA